jgi:hypothetical protein
MVKRSVAPEPLQILKVPINPKTYNFPIGSRFMIGVTMYLVRKVNQSAEHDLRLLYADGEQSWWSVLSIRDECLRENAQIFES